MFFFVFSHSIVFDFKKFHPRYNFYGLFRGRIKLIQPNKDNLIIGKKCSSQKPNNQIDFTLLIPLYIFFAILARGNAVVVAFTLFELLCAVVGLRLL
jgi:hypothetical protein